VSVVAVVREVKPYLALRASVVEQTVVAEWTVQRPRRNMVAVKVLINMRLVIIR